MNLNIKITCIITALAFIATSCHKLDVEIDSKLTDENFPVTVDQAILASGPVYTRFRTGYPRSYWFLQSISSDEAVLPARGGNWWDGGRYAQLHLHTWNADNATMGEAWDYLSTTISTANQILSTLENAPAGAPAQIVAEVRTMRALSIFMMMDLWGNIPLVTRFGDTSQVRTTQRKEVFAFLESELKSVLPDLSTTADNSTYGRPTRYAAFALLAKMYLNAPVYAGEDRNSDAVAMCDSIIQDGKFELESNYLAMFNINNGPTDKEFILAVPYDGAQATEQIFARYSLHRAMRNKYSLPFTPSGAVSTWPEFYALYNDPNDVRNQVWLTGRQYNYNGTPITIATTKVGYDEDYTGSDASAPYNFELELTPDIIIKDPAIFDAGNDEKSWAQGYRCNKFYPDSTSSSRNQGNDMPVFRYADILLMKAEAILRGAAPTLGATALSLVNEVRTARNAAAWSNITLDLLLDERGREFAWENWRRNDLIRFGKFEGSWGYKTDANAYKRLYPVPTYARVLNPLLSQNPGY
ncbi:RagB/SusD family nutrient uptake outer membrane protein [Chitinophaga japonensis]|uniref:Putative outer membrane starch-binding protein n=1 Tax=Chitinophaga japonensis TaxID=104662 RepID=A0A562TDY3_CHIJA|nr:RagB/SusD family nutrient uptake outer membrane protein [Chitinophaga japonensis]TWI91593.1 putative outer membrane starch-binding protein [Chitinophaga japonensis]